MAVISRYTTLGRTMPLLVELSHRLRKGMSTDSCAGLLQFCAVDRSGQLLAAADVLDVRDVQRSTWLKICVYQSPEVVCCLRGQMTGRYIIWGRNGMFAARHMHTTSNGKRYRYRYPYRPRCRRGRRWEDVVWWCLRHRYMDPDGFADPGRRWSYVHNILIVAR